MSNQPTNYAPLSTAITVKNAAQAIEFSKKVTPAEMQRRWDAMVKK